LLTKRFSHPVPLNYALIWQTNDQLQLPSFTSILASFADVLFATGTALNETEPVPVENNVLAMEANKEVYHYKKIKT